ncbi:chemotaxis protein CheB [Daejeonella oryzae]|uniref:chemotaxis protein CheB n=1 Tax=Daejeonella oryzae TaxID=1122943 RepID=UPI000407550B|nr:chemotaxis protein CheB [Daejeonella oryzae]
MLVTEPHHIIAIGASAGGMEEINTFFDHTPLDGVSYVIVQHLSPDFKSRMVELLARHSKLLVKEAKDGMTVISNQVYLIPNDKFMTIRNWRLYLTDKNEEPAPHLTINKFFTSLAECSGSKAIGIILSGLGSDGTKGIIDIKKAGGMVMARNPETSEFGSMPSNAIATGMVDFVMEPQLMPDAIEDYVMNEGKIDANTKDDDKNLEDIINLIKERLPLDFSDYKKSTILRRIKRRASYNNFTNLSSYFHFLNETPDEVATLAQDFLISVTSFFRDKEAYEMLQNKVLPDLLDKLSKDEELKLWVAGCATGEEAYSLAILLREQLTGKFKDVVVKIFATDIDNPALVHAGKGIYTSGITKDVSQKRLDRFFIKEGESYRVKPEIRKMVIFAQHDLVKNPPYCNMHFVSCRNLLIYMTPILQKKIYLMLLFGLKKDGYLFLGSSENPMPIIQNLEVIDKKWKIYKNLESNRVVRFDAFSLPLLIDKKQTLSSPSREDSSQNVNTVEEAVNGVLVEQLDSLVICIDENNQVVKSYGDTTKYLLQKNFNSNLTELLPRPLAIAFNTLSKTAVESGKKASVCGIKIKHDKLVIKVCLSINPLIIKKGMQKFRMVTLSEDKSLVATQHEEAVFDEKIYLDQYVINLEEELVDLKDKLNSTYLQLDASNENMQSFNEELLSANEEMQSTNEEMQSVNEELHTINADYQLKNKELLELNDDLNNYFRSNVNGQLFVNNDLELMRFSPGTVKQINLLPSDVGRPLSNISTNIKFETILEDIKKVLKEGSIIDKEIETDDGKWYQIMTMPYLQQADNKVTGAIITFNDITKLKKTQLELDKKNESLLRINADLDNFVYAASHDLLAPLSNIEGSIAVMNKIKVTDPKLNEFLQVINSSVKKFRNLVKDLSSIAKLESGMMITEMVDLNELINDVEWSLENKIKTSDVEISRDLQVKQLPFSKKNLRSIIYNLISNSVKFKREQPCTIHIRTFKEGDTVILSVEDNGIGIPKEKLGEIFNMYGRLQLDIEGQGIGLYLAKKLIDSTGGKIVVESEQGIGSNFKIYFNA